MSARSRHSRSGRNWVQHWFVRYAIAVVAVVAATLLRLAIGQAFSANPVFITYYPAVVLVAVLCGLWPGILTTLLSCFCVNYFFFGAHGLRIARPADGLGLALFAAMGVCVAIMAEKARRREVAALSSEEHHLAVIATMREGVTVQDATGAIQSCNPRAEQILGLRAVEMKGVSSLDPRWRAIHEDGSPFPGENHPAMVTLRTGQPQHDVCMGLERPDGTVTWIQINSLPLSRVGNSSARVVTTFTDITRRKQAEDALRASDERFRIALQNSPVVVFNQNLDLQYTWINSPVGAWRATEWLGKTDAEIIEEPEEAARLTEVKRRILETGTPVREEIPVHFNGKPIYYYFSGEPLRDPSGKVVGITCAVTDITERKQAEEKLRRASLYARSLIEASVDPLVTISRDGRITDVNQATERVTGFPREHLIGSDFSEYFTEPQKAREIYQKVFDLESVHDYPLAIRHVSGNVTHVLYNASLFRNETGDVEGVFAAARDITERKTLEEQLLQSQKLEAVGRLAGGIAHDFNNIMSIIIGYSEMVERTLLPDDPNAERLTSILKATDRAAALTRQLLAFSRKQVMNIGPVELNQRITEWSTVLTRLLGETVELRLELAPDVGQVRADAVQIEQVLTNLAVNARDAMPSGGTLTITSSIRDVDTEYCRVHPEVNPGRYAVISVSDTGEGMNEETLSRIFEPFFTTKEIGRGTGLGLSIIYGIVRQSGGHIEVFSTPGRGTTFNIYLQRILEATEQTSPKTVSKVAESHSGTILVVEDERALGEMVQAMLQGVGYTVLLAGSGEEALKLSRAYGATIDLVLTDVILSAGINGMKVAAELRELRPEIRVIYMSGYSEALVNGEDGSGPDAVLLEKPFTIEMLVRTVKEELRQPSGSPPRFYKAGRA